MSKTKMIIVILILLFVGGLYYVFCKDHCIKTYSVGELARQGKLEVTIKKVETKEYLINDKEKSRIEKNIYNLMTSIDNKDLKCLVVDIEVKNNLGRPLKFNRFNFNAITEFTESTNPLLPEDIKNRLSLSLEKNNLLEYTVFPNTTVEGLLVFLVKKESKAVRITVYANRGDETGFSGAVFYSSLK